MADQDNRTLPASERKIRKAREDGQIARSRDLGHLLTLGVFGAVTIAALPHLSAWLQRTLASALSFSAADARHPEQIFERLQAGAFAWLLVLIPIGLLGAFLAVAAAVASGGWNFTWKALQPKFSKLNPLSGLQQMVSVKRLGDVGKSSLLAVIVGVVGGVWLKGHMADFQQALGLPLPQALEHLGDTFRSGLVLLGILLLAAALLDVPLQRHLLANQLKMSHQEAKQEHKETEGSPEVKGRIRQRMREMGRKRMMAAVPTADLVVMNPQHYAVALKYDDEKMAAPIVVAKGTDRLALKIRDLAKEHRVPVLEAPPLARALYTHTELENPVPQRLFAAVAQVLAYVFRLRAAMRGEGPWPQDLGPLDVPPDLDPHAA